MQGYVSLARGWSTFVIVLCITMVCCHHGWAQDAPVDALDSENVSQEVGPSQAIGTRNLLEVLNGGGPMLFPIGICSFILFIFVFERSISLRRHPRAKIRIAWLALRWRLSHA